MSRLFNSPTDKLQSPASQKLKKFNKRLEPNSLLSKLKQESRLKQSVSAEDQPESESEDLETRDNRDNLDSRDNRDSRDNHRDIAKAAE